VRGGEGAGASCGGGVAGADAGPGEGEGANEAGRAEDGGRAVDAQVAGNISAGEALSDASGSRLRHLLPERQELAKLGKSPELLIRFTLAYAKGHPRDKLVPEALHESVQQTRFARNYCGSYEDEDKARSALSKEAFQLLQRNYGKTEWAKETPYHY
jgi:hypothetical protein